MTGLTTHVLDTARGRPARSVPITLQAVHGAQRTLLTRTCTNADGRTDAPLLTADDLRPGTYELTFAVAEYFSDLLAGTPPFLDDVMIRFTVTDAGAHYHVPLLVSPWAYSTYRGS